jgi:hypothetical protein
LLATIQRPANASQRIAVTSVWKRASRYRSNLWAIPWKCARISGCDANFRLGISQLFKHRQIKRSLRIARCARIAVPIPYAAEIGASLQDADTCDTRLAQIGAEQQGAQPTADDEHVDLIA